MTDHAICIWGSRQEAIDGLLTGILKVFRVAMAPGWDFHGTQGSGQGTAWNGQERRSGVRKPREMESKEECL